MLIISQYANEGNFLHGKSEFVGKQCVHHTILEYLVKIERTDLIQFIPPKPKTGNTKFYRIFEEWMKDKAITFEAIKRNYGKVYNGISIKGKEDPFRKRQNESNKEWRRRRDELDKLIQIKIDQKVKNIEKLKMEELKSEKIDEKGKVQIKLGKIQVEEPKKQKVQIKPEKIQVENIEGKKKKKSKTIPKKLRNKVFTSQFGELPKFPCCCCGEYNIDPFNYIAGHVKSRKDGGEDIIENLRPICQPCNSSMGSRNMDEFMAAYQLNQNKEPQNNQQLIQGGAIKSKPIIRTINQDKSSSDLVNKPKEISTKILTSLKVYKAIKITGEVLGKMFNSCF